MNLNQLPTVAMTMVLVAAIFVGGFLVVSGIQSDLCPSGYTFSEAAGVCQLNTNTSVTTTTSATNATVSMTSGMSNITGYAPTWGTIIGVAILLAIVIGGFAFGRNKGYL